MPGDPRGWEAPDHLRIYDWDKIMKVMKDLGYVLIDIHEHEFQKDRVSVEFEVSIPLSDFAGVSESDIELIQIEGITFRLPSLEQYLSIYKASSQDSYRNDHNNNKDFKKDRVAGKDICKLSYEKVVSCKTGCFFLFLLII